MEKKNCPSNGFWRALIIIAAVIGAFVAAEAILERVFKKYLKITVELEDIDDLDDDCCCCDEDEECDCECDCDCDEDEDCGCDDCCDEDEDCGDDCECCKPEDEAGEDAAE